MTDKTSIILRYALIGFMLIAVVVFGIFYFGGTVSPANYDIAIQGLEEEAQIPVFTGLAINLAIAYFLICAVAAILFPIVLFNLKKAKNTLIGIGVLVVIVAISYFMAGTEPVQIIDYEGEMSESMLKNVGTGINLMFFLIGLALVSWIYAEVSRIFK
jgi:hypothetical protein